MQENRGLLARLGSFVRWLLLAVLVCAAGLVVFRQMVIDRLDEEIRVRLESMFAAHYTDMEVRIQGARRLEGKGIEIRGLSIRSLHEETAYRDLLYIDEMFLECRAGFGRVAVGPTAGAAFDCAAHETARHLPPGRALEHCQPAAAARFWRLGAGDCGGGFHRRSCRISVVNRVGYGPCATSNVQAQSTRRTAKGKQQWQFAGKLLGDHFKHVQLQGLIRSSGQLVGLGHASMVWKCPSDCSTSLPNDVAKYVSLLATLRARRTFRVSRGARAGRCAADRVRGAGSLVGRTCRRSAFAAPTDRPGSGRATAATSRFASRTSPLAAVPTSTGTDLPL